MSMRNLISPEIYIKLMDKYTEDAAIHSLLTQWDKQGGPLTDYLAMAVLGLCEERTRLIDELVDLKLMQPSVIKLGPLFKEEGEEL
jgi:hypothetical protein